MAKWDAIEKTIPIAMQNTKIRIVYFWKVWGLTNKVQFSSSVKPTRIFMQEEGKWLCIHDHNNLLP